MADETKDQHSEDEAEAPEVRELGEDELDQIAGGSSMMPTHHP